MDTFIRNKYTLVLDYSSHLSHAWEFSKSFDKPEWAIQWAKDVMSNDPVVVKCGNGVMLFDPEFNIIWSGTHGK